MVIAATRGTGSQQRAALRYAAKPSGGGFPRNYSSKAMKQCAKCKLVKPLTAFSPRRRGDHEPRCKQCRAEDARQRYASDPAKALARIKGSRKRNAGKAWASGTADRSKRAARCRVTDLVHKGKLAKPNACTACGKATPKHRLEGHHEDHSKPLEIEWLCNACHNRRHGNRPAQ